MLSIIGVENEDVWFPDGIALVFLDLVTLISSPDGLIEGFRNIGKVTVRHNL